MTDTPQTKILDEVSKEIFNFIYHTVDDPEGNDDNLAQEITSNLMKKLEPIIIFSNKKSRAEGLAEGRREERKRLRELYEK